MTAPPDTPARRFADEQIVNGADVLFSELMRAAQRAALDYAHLTEADKWPTFRIIKRFAQAFDVPVDVLGASFGLMMWADGDKSCLADVVRRPASRVRTRGMLGRQQAAAYGWFLALERSWRKRGEGGEELH